MPKVYNCQLGVRDLIYRLYIKLYNDDSNTMRYFCITNMIIRLTCGFFRRKKTNCFFFFYPYLVLPNYSLTHLYTCSQTDIQHTHLHTHTHIHTLINLMIYLFIITSFHSFFFCSMPLNGMFLK